jgi:hypothetical protein
LVSSIPRGEAWFWAAILRTASRSAISRNEEAAELKRATSREIPSESRGANMWSLRNASGMRAVSRSSARTVTSRLRGSTERAMSFKPAFCTECSVQTTITASNWRMRDKRPGR